MYLNKLSLNHSFPQLTLCTVSPVFNRKFGRLATNLGFQLNFRLPWQLVDFYRPTARAATDIITGKIRPGAESEENGRYYKDAIGLSAGKMYKAIEAFMEAMDFHPDCLVKSVCELAHVPFDSDEEHLVQQVVHFLLTPSEHLSFHESEKIMQKRFEKAERAGRHKKDCNRLYQKCTQSFISLITAINHE
ncbi:uncharacterized protein LOC110679653 [Aedes aegypti]|uniref:Uncharacterized protein n=1 Tax=Aedes aegypti TaxID=7159 RepID=A0A6I8TWM8_AEDAE|nr:uncharacterized protein LOC110679653 [Aedes aegypti]